MDIRIRTLAQKPLVCMDTEQIDDKVVGLHVCIPYKDGYFFEARGRIHGRVLRPGVMRWDARLEADMRKAQMTVNKSSKLLKNNSISSLSSSASSEPRE